MYTHIAKQYLLVDDTQFEQLLPSLENKACLGFVAVRAVAPEQITRSDPDKDQNGHPSSSQDSMTIGPWCFTHGENQRGLCLLAIEFRCDFAGFSRSSRLAEISEPLWGSAECCQMHPVCIGHSDSGMTCVSSGGSLSQAGRSEQLQLSMKSRTRQGKSRQS